MASILYMDRLDCPEDTVKYLKRDIRKVIEKYLNIENADVSIRMDIKREVKQGLKMLRQYKLKDYKFRLVLWVLILSVIGIMVIGSANGSYQMKQMIGMGVGIVFMIMVSLMDYLWISNFYWIYYIGGLVLLIAVRFFGTEVNGAKRWIDFGGFSFQPSDIMKIVVIIFLLVFHEA